MTTPNERDRSLQKWLASSMPHTDARTDACLDPETAAAWVDGGLADGARQRAEAHVSVCARCQALVSALLTLEAAAPAVDVPASADLPSHSRWRGWLDWMLPAGALAAAALALGIWLNVPRPPARQADVAPSARLEPTPDAAGSSRSAKTDPAPLVGLPTNTTPGASAEAASKAAPERLDAPSASNRATAGSVAAEPQALAEAPAAPAAPAAVAAQQDATGNRDFAAREAAAIEVTSPDGQVRWRLAGRLVLRSSDGGGTWATVVDGTTGRLLAGAAPDAAVCWLVGERGLVLRSSNGVDFTQVGAPASVDLSSVSATSATDAMVVASDGRRFATRDGGASWVPVP